MEDFLVAKQKRKLKGYIKFFTPFKKYEVIRTKKARHFYNKPIKPFIELKILGDNNEIFILSKKTIKFFYDKQEWRNQQINKLLKHSE